MRDIPPKPPIESKGKEKESQACSENLKPGARVCAHTHARIPKRTARLAEFFKAHLYDRSAVADVELSVDQAMKQTGCDEAYRLSWELACIVIGINNFIDLAFMATAYAKQEGIHSPAGFLGYLLKLKQASRMKQVKKASRSWIEGQTSNPKTKGGVR